MDKNTPLHIANYFIKKGIEEGKPITPMKAIKLTYIAHGWYLGLVKDLLFHEDIQAWKFGPVIQSLYHNLKRYGNSPINELIENKFYSTENRAFITTHPIATKTAEPGGEIVVPLLDKIWAEYNKYSAVELSAMTHRDGTPWHKTWNQLGGRSREGVVIPSELIADYYSSLVSGED